MINRKNELGKNPAEVGEKDAVHVAIVSVRAGANMKPGQPCKMNEYNEAVPGTGFGVVDVFLKKDVKTGDNFWVMLNQDIVPNVKHMWDIGQEFIPKREVVYNEVLKHYADELGLTYQQLMDVCAKCVNGGPVEYNGTFDDIPSLANMDLYELWSEWAEETGYQFENYGIYCCPEYEYPRELFK